MGKMAILYAGLAGSQAACAANFYINYATQRTAALQAYLSRASELTDKVLEAANKAVENSGSANLWAGYAFATAAGLFAGLALYDATKTLIKRHEEKTEACAKIGLFAP